MLRKPETIIPILKEIVSPDVDLLSYKPEDASNFGISVECVIGAESRKGGDLFQLTICSPTWLHDKGLTHPAMWGRHFLIQSQYDLAAARKMIEEMLLDSSGADWRMAAARISRYMDWEFEDYKE